MNSKLVCICMTIKLCLRSMLVPLQWSLVQMEEAAISDLPYFR